MRKGSQVRCNFALNLGLWEILGQFIPESKSKPKAKPAWFLTFILPLTFESGINRLHYQGCCPGTLDTFIDSVSTGIDKR